MSGNEPEPTGELGSLDTPVPHREETSEVMDTVSGFEKQCRDDHVRLKHTGPFESCPEETCVDARDLLESRSPGPA